MLCSISCNAIVDQRRNVKMANNTTEDLNAISTLHEEVYNGNNIDECIDLLAQRNPVKDPVAIRGAGNVTV